MKTKTNKTNNGRSFARIALAATTVLALAGRAHAAPCANDGHYVSTVGQACTPCPTGTKSDGIQDGSTLGFCSMVAAGYYGDAGVPGASGKHAQAVGGGATLCTDTATCPKPCPTGSSTSAASKTNVAIAACTLDAGYYISTLATDTTAAGLVISAAPQNYYVLTGSAISVVTTTDSESWDGTTADKAAAAGVIACPPNSFTADAGSTTLASCLVKPGYYISTQATSATNADGLVITAVPADHYSTGKIGTTAISASSQSHRWDGTTASAAAAAGVIACPFAGTTSSAGRSLLTECVPDCASTTSNAEDASGTCRCKANYYGTPKDTNGATVFAVTTKCTACDAGKTAVAGSTAASACTGAAADADTAASGAAGMSVLAAISAMAAAQLVL